MTYYVMRTNPIYNVLPVPINWYGKINVDDICKEQAHQIADRQVLAIETRENLIWVDMIDQPFPLVNEVIKDVMRLYIPQLKSKQVILLDSQQEQMNRYFIPILPRCCAALKIGQGGANKLLVDLQEYIWIPDMDAFYVQDSYGKLHVLISLSMAESILRRQAKGIWLEEIEIEKE